MRTMVATMLPVLAVMSLKSFAVSCEHISLEGKYEQTNANDIPTLRPHRNPLWQIHRSSNTSGSITRIAVMPGNTIQEVPGSSMSDLVSITLVPEGDNCQVELKTRDGIVQTYSVTAVSPQGQITLDPVSTETGETTFRLIPERAPANI